MESLATLLAEAVVVEPLGGCPVACLDLKALAAKVHEEGRLLVADVSLMGPDGCPAVRLGVDVAVVAHEGSWQAVEACRALERQLPVVRGEATAPHWRAVSDAAQVVASYLRCHPRVTVVRYPGLKSDPSFAIAARTLVGGFGPIVDYQLVGEDDWHRLMCTDEDARVQVMRMERALGDTP